MTSGNFSYKNDPDTVEWTGKSLIQTGQDWPDCFDQGFAESLGTHYPLDGVNALNDDPNTFFVVMSSADAGCQRLLQLTQSGLALFVDTSGVSSEGPVQLDMKPGPLDSKDDDSISDLILRRGQKETPLQFTEWGFWLVTKLNFVLYILNQLKERMVFI